MGNQRLPLKTRYLSLILGDQLNENISCLKDFDASCDRIVMGEIWDETKYVKHHKKKIAYIFSAMRHFAQGMTDKGFVVDYTRLADEGPVSFTALVEAAIQKYQPERLIVTFPGEYRVLQMFEEWHKTFPIPVEIREDDRFLCSPLGFAAWAKDKRQLRMEYFYREMRQKYGVLIDHDGKPVGGQWNYDAENRKPPPKNHLFPKRLAIPPDSITTEVMALVAARFADHFGDLEPFVYAVTASDAQACLDDFIRYRLPHFGDYQDAMLNDEPYLYHSHIGQYLNSGLLDPLECCRQVEQAYHDGKVPLPAAEGFIRQIMGWREYVRGVYWLKMPEYKQGNYFNANRQLPWFYWSGDTKMQCIRQCVRQTREHAYAHHIQRLMVTGAFALMAGIHPDFVNEWYMIVYSDAYEWVELPNVTGMILFADGGYMASKPYAASGKYINRMSNYCKHCQYDVNKTTGEDACPFNFLYWDFLMRHESKLAGNHRMQMMMKHLERMDDPQKNAIRQQARLFLDDIAPLVSG